MKKVTKDLLPDSFRLSDLQENLVEVGEVIKGFYGSAPKAMQKEDGSPVTLADQHSDDFLKKTLKDFLPEAGWLSEESRDEFERLAREWIWIVDPLDGTKEFIEGVPEFAVSIGLVRNEHVVAGGVYNPVSGEGGVGACDGSNRFWGFPAPRRSAENLAEAVASVSRTEVKENEPVDFCERLHLRPIGSVAYKLLRVAAGVEDIAFSLQPKWEWDICGGVALLKSVGKVYSRLDGVSVCFNQRNPRIMSGAVGGGKKLVSEFLDEYVRLTCAS